MSDISKKINEIRNSADGQSSRKPIAEALRDLYNSGGSMTTFGGYSTPDQFATKEEVMTMFNGSKPNNLYNSPYVLAFDRSMKDSKKSIISGTIAKVLGDVDSLYKKVRGVDKYKELMDVDYNITINDQTVNKKLFPNGYMVKLGGN